ncbi:hypothetical protein D3C86_2083700 [compost metagenome]
MRIEHADLAGGGSKRQQACAEDIQGVQLAVTKIRRLTQTVPATAKAWGENISDVDFCELGHFYCSSCGEPRLRAWLMFSEQQPSLIPHLD